MADNVLGTLFQDIADAIRTKTGGTNTMVPASFPEEILSIVTGGGGEGGSVDFVSAKGTVTPVAGGMTIEHNLGVVPDYFAIYANSSISASSLTDNALVFTDGISTAFAEATGLSFAHFTACAPTGAMTSWDVGVQIDSTKNIFGGLKNATATTIQVGGGAADLYTGSDLVWVALARKNPDSSTAEIRETKTVEADFSGGDMEIIPSGDAYSLAKVIIPQPETLIPENIALGIDIAGIIGTSEGASKVKFASGQVTVGSKQKYTVEHGLGVTPDFVWTATGSTSSSNDAATDTVSRIIQATGMSTALAEATAPQKWQAVASYRKRTGTTNYTLSVSTHTVGIDGTSGWITNANEKSFVVGNDSHQYYSSFYWFAIGGLT